MKTTSLQYLISGLTESPLDISDKSFVNEEINQRNLEMSVLYKITPRRSILEALTLQVVTLLSVTLKTVCLI